MRTKALVCAFLSIVLIGLIHPPATRADELQDAVDNPEQNGAPLIFTSQTSSGGALWSADTTTYMTAPASARSGHISGNMYSTLTTTVTGPASLSFYQKISSQASSDTLKFMINGAVKSTISGTVNWQQKVFTLATGTYTLQWKYSKNATVDSGSDAAWVDKIVVSPNTALKVIYPNGGEVLSAGTSTNITWNAPAAAESYDLYFYNGSTWTLINTEGSVTSNTKTGISYPWTVSTTPGNKTTCKVKVVAKAGTGTVTDMSDKPFTVSVLQVTYPNGKESLDVTTTPTVTVGFLVSGLTNSSASATVTSSLSPTPICTIPGGIAPGPYSCPWNVPAATTTKSVKLTVVIRSGTGAMLATDTSDANFTILPAFSISGKVTYNGAGLGGVTVSVSGAAIASAVTDTLGNFIVKGLKKGTYALTPGMMGFDMTPQSISKTVTSGNITGVTFTAASLTEYAPYDLAATWYSAGIRTPVKGSGDPSKFGYDIEKIVLGSNGSGSITSVSRSDPGGSSSIPAGTITIESSGANAGVISNGDPNSFLFLNRHKDVVYQLRVEQNVSEQELFFVIKKAPSYSAADLPGTWYVAGIKTPVKNNSNAANFGFDVTQLVLASDGSGTAIQILTSDSTATATFPPGTFTITNDGVISNGEPNNFWFMNAHKDVMYQFFKDPATGEQQLFLLVKKGDSYSAADLPGSWFGAGIKTPVKNTFNSANLGYEVSKLVLAGDGSGTATQISSSDPAGPTILPAGSLIITYDGQISDGNPNSLWFMNADKDTMYHFTVDASTKQQQLFIYLKQAQPYAPVGGSFSISGIVTNLTPTSGPVLICVGMDPTFNSGCSYGAAADGAGVYTVPNVPAGTYYVGALQDVNSNNQRDSNEPQGAYGAPTGILLTHNMTDVDFSIGWPRMFVVGTNPSVIKIDADGNAWVSNFGSNSVSKVSLNGTVVSYPVGTNPHGLDFDASGNVWVANYGSNNVTKLSSTGSLLATYPVGTNPRGLHIDASGNVWVANHGGGGTLGNTVTKLGSDGSLIGTFTVGKGPYSITTDGSGNVWVTNKGGTTLGTTVTRLNSSGTSSNTYPVGSGPHAIRTDPSGNVWVSNAGNDTTLSDTVMKLNGNGSLLGTSVVGIGPHGLGVDVSGNVWVANYGTSAQPGNSITRLDANGTPLNTLPSGGDSPAGVAIDASGNIWVSNYDSGTVAVLPGAAEAGYNP